MKFASNFILFLLTLSLLEGKALSLSNYKIKKICKKERNELICIKNLQEKRSDLEKGYIIEIPVRPYKK